ncbi:MAG: NADH-quinone oxidoreductase subunit J [Azoarcus sp.]|jgi:NADH-quinone oxidoreductase subunit J|nr:NADH-quinone oxidoreductase subunit J [Azoarcus sp.]
MEFKTFVFYLLSSILVLAALRVVTARNPVHAVLYLVLAFFNASGIWLLLSAEFLAITLVMVYVGAVMVLFLFVVMMLDIDFARLREGFWRYLPVGAFVGVLLALEMGLVLAGGFGGKAMPPAGATVSAADAGLFKCASNTCELGRVLYTDYAYAFELAAFVLLIAMVAAVSLTLRRRRTDKYIAPEVQVAARHEDRMTLVKMSVEKEAPSVVETAETGAEKTGGQ